MYAWAYCHENIIPVCICMCVCVCVMLPDSYIVLHLQAGLLSNSSYSTYIHLVSQYLYMYACDDIITMVTDITANPTQCTLNIYAM